MKTMVGLQWAKVFVSVEMCNVVEASLDLFQFVDETELFAG